MYFSTLGHFFASSAASAEVIRRQLLSPKPSASASVIFLLPHHDGAPATGLPPPLLPEALPLSSLPQAAATTATLARTAIVALGFQMALLMDLLLRWTDRPGVIPGWRPRNGPTRVRAPHPAPVSTAPCRPRARAPERPPRRGSAPRC